MYSVKPGDILFFNEDKKTNFAIVVSCERDNVSMLNSEVCLLSSEGVLKVFSEKRHRCETEYSYGRYSIPYQDLPKIVDALCI